MKKLATLNPEGASKSDIDKYFVRNAVRAIVVDQDNQVALVHSYKNNHFKLPGGGIEKGETKESALTRECMEEIGSKIEINKEVGYIIEYRKTDKLKQISYCYIAKLKNNKGWTNYMKDEIEEGFEAVWLPYDKALSAISLNRATSFEGMNYIVPRDSLFLKSAKKLLFQ